MIVALAGIALAKKSACRSQLKVARHSLIARARSFVQQDGEARSCA